MQHNLPLALSEVLEFEGGLVDHPQDPGGLTNMGVTIRTMRRILRNEDLRQRIGFLNQWADPATMVRGLTESEVRTIYRELYASPIRFHLWPNGIDVMALDTAINQGPRRAILFGQRALNKCGANIAEDGVWGPETKGAIQSYPRGSSDLRKLLIWFTTFRLLHWSSLNKLVFEKGWFRRGLSVFATAVTTLPRTSTA